jgi:hypothetical protein
MPMTRVLTIAIWCGTLAVSSLLVGGCRSQNNADTSFEKQIRAPKGPPPPEAMKAMAEIQAAEQRDRARGVK